MLLNDVAFWFWRLCDNSQGDILAILNFKQCSRIGWQYVTLWELLQIFWLACILNACWNRLEMDCNILTWRLFDSAFLRWKDASRIVLYGILYLPVAIVGQLQVLRQLEIVNIFMNWKFNAGFGQLQTGILTEGTGSYLECVFLVDDVTNWAADSLSLLRLDHNLKFCALSWANNFPWFVC